MQVASVISCLVRVYVLPVAVVGFTWETISDMSTSSMSGGSGNVNDGAGKCGWRKVTMTEPVSRKIGDPIKLGTPVPYFPENRGPHPQFFGNLGIPHPYISRNLGIPL